MAKHVDAPRELLNLLASYGGVLTTELLCYNGDVETLAALLHANPSLPFDEHTLHALIDMGHQHVVELILRHQPDVLKPFALRRAKTPEFARWLMERGLDPRRGNWLGITPLHRCASEGQIETATVCLAFGADIDAVDTEYSSTPLGWAARAGQNAMVEWLLKQGANADRPEDEPWALPFAWAKRGGHHEVIEILGQDDRPDS